MGLAASTKRSPLQRRSSGPRAFSSTSTTATRRLVSQSIGVSSTCGPIWETRGRTEMMTTQFGQAAGVVPDSATDRLEILELTSKLGLLVDAREWEALRRLFTDPVEVDYTSLNGGEPQSPSPSDLVDDWRRALEALVSTQHLIAGQVVELEGDRATCV